MDGGVNMTGRSYSRKQKVKRDKNQTGPMWPIMLPKGQNKK